MSEHATFEWAPIALGHVALDGTILRANRRLRALLGRDAATLAGLRVADVTHPDDLAIDLHHGGRLLAGEIDEYTLDKRYVRPDGTLVAARLAVALVRDRAGSPLHLVAAVDPLGEGHAFRRMAGRDDAAASDRPAIDLLRETEATLGAVLDALPIGLVVADARGRVLRDNAAHRALWGSGPRTASWEQYGEWEGYWPDSGRRIQADEWAMARALLRGEVVRGELVECQPFDGGPHRYYLASAAPVRDAAGGVVGGVLVELDVTEARAAQQRLAASEERLRLAVQSSSLGWWDMDPRTGDVAWSENAQRLFDFPAHERLSLADAASRIHPDDRERVEAAMEAAVASDADGTYHQTYRVVWRDGTVRWVDAVGAVRFESVDGQRRASRFTGVLWDVTEQRQMIEALAQSEERFRLIADTMPQIVWATRPDGYHDYFNERWYEYTGMPRPDEPGGEYDPSGSGQGWSWKDYLHPDDQAQTFAAWGRSLRTGEPYQVEYRFKRRDGAWRWFMGRALALRDPRSGAITRWFGTLTDIDDAKRMAHERDALVAQLREADRRKDEFLAMLAHELRNPLAPVANAVRLLQREPSVGPIGKRAVGMVDRQVRHMTRLVDDLLEVSRITRGTIALRPQALVLDELVASAVEAALPASQDKRQRLTTALPARAVQVFADPVRIAQVLENLLSNAIKYTPDGGASRVELDAPDAGDGFVELRVIDDGIGIVPEKLEAVFDLFVQAEPGVGAHQGGLGIGLGMVKRLVEMHGGTVDARSAGPGRGATFTVRLPRVAAVAGSAPGEAAAV